MTDGRFELNSKLPSLVDVSLSKFTSDYPESFPVDVTICPPLRLAGRLSSNLQLSIGEMKDPTIQPITSRPKTTMFITSYRFG